MNIDNQNEILDFGEDPVTSVEAKLAILAFPYNWVEMVEQEEKLKNNEDIPGPQNCFRQTEVNGTADVAAESSTLELANSKEEIKSLYDSKVSNETYDYKHTILVDTNISPNKRDSRLLQLGEKEIQEAETNSNASPEKTDEAPKIDNSVIQRMNRLVHIYDAVSGVAMGQIHAQYLPGESDKDDRPPAIPSAETQTSNTESGTTIPKESQCSDVLENSQIPMPDGKTAKSSAKNRTKNILGLEVIDTEISLKSTEMIEYDIQESKSESEVENDYFRKRPLINAPVSLWTTLVLQKSENQGYGETWSVAENSETFPQELVV